MSELCNEIEKLGKGIGNANRYRILESLMQGPRTVNEIVHVVKLPQPAVSQNLKVLRSADLVTDERCGQEIRYSRRSLRRAAPERAASPDSPPATCGR